MATTLTDAGSLSPLSHRPAAEDQRENQRENLPLSPSSHTRRTPRGTLLIVLPIMPPEDRDCALENIATSMPGQPLVVAAADDAGPLPSPPSAFLRYVSYAPAISHELRWIHTAADFHDAHELVVRHSAAAVMLLGAEAHTLHPNAIAAIAAPLFDDDADLSLARYILPPRTGLVNSAILYPVTRALFASAARFPLALDLGLSKRMAQRLAASAQVIAAQGDAGSLLWPIAEAAAAGYKVAEAAIGERALPAPVTLDLNAVLTQVVGSLFAEIDSRAAYWQRARRSPPTVPGPMQADNISAHDVEPMLDAFRLAYTNLHEIWSLVLPPQSLLSLKRLSLVEAAQFRMPDSLWARIIYDFILAYRLRTINRSHLLGALTPLYLGWVASHLLLTSAGGVSPEEHINAVAAAFETDKAYLVSRWRWPDRFNP